MNTTDYEIVNTRAVLTDRVLDDATVVVRDGLIVDVTTRTLRSTTAIDARGVHCLPGLVDTHSDGLEKEMRPRPGVILDDDFALASFEGRVRAAGITTIFHGIGFEEDDRNQRSVEQAVRLCGAISDRALSDHALIDHRILYRLDARDADGFDALMTVLPQRRDTSIAPLVSFEDHTPGQGQYMDRTAMERYVMGTRGLDENEARRQVDEMIAARDAMIHNRERALPHLTEAARCGEIRLMAHDPATLDDITEAVTWHASIAEFPTTLDAARAAREAGLRIVCGAPNVVRGRSHSGNVSARDLIAAGLCDVLASDYLPSTLMGAVAGLAADGICDLATAVELVAGGPAETVGLEDRGRIEAGRRADLVLVHFAGSLPTIRAVLRPDRDPVAVV